MALWVAMELVSVIIRAFPSSGDSATKKTWTYFSQVLPLVAGTLFEPALDSLFKVVGAVSGSGSFIDVIHPIAGNNNEDNQSLMWILNGALACWHPSWLGTPTSKFIQQMLAPIILAVLVSILVGTRSSVHRIFGSLFAKSPATSSNNNNNNNSLIDEDEEQELVDGLQRTASIDNDSQYSALANDDEENCDQWTSNNEQMDEIAQVEADSIDSSNNKSWKHTIKQRSKQAFSSLLSLSIIEQITQSTLQVLYASYFPLVLSILAMLQCTTPFDWNGHQLNQPGATFVANIPWLSCNSSEYATIHILAWVSFVLYIVGIPALFGVLLVLLRNNAQARQRWIGFYCSGFEQHVFWFEVRRIQPSSCLLEVKHVFVCELLQMLLLARKLVLALAISLIPVTSVWQPGVINAVFALSIFAVWRIKPYARVIDRVMEVSSTILLWITFSVASSTNYAFAFQFEEEQAARHAVNWFSIFAWSMTAAVGLLLASLTVLTIWEDVLQYVPLIASVLPKRVLSTKQWIQQQFSAWSTRWHLWVVGTAVLVAAMVLLLELIGVLYWIVHERLVVFVVIAVEMIVVTMFIVLY